jgi:cobalt/nickel transport system ATP-binding protein
MNAVDVSRFGFAYQARAVLHEVNLAVAPGEAVGLVGANGSGKSTLLWAIAGLLKGEGQVRVFGEKPDRTVWKRIGMVFQNPEDQLFMPSLEQDLALRLANGGLNRRTAEARALQELKRFGLESCAGRPATQMSLGQRKRAAIAAALVTEPDLLLVDEPTAELDGRAVRELAGILNSIGAAKLIASHDLAFLGKVATRVAVLMDGSVACEGPAGAILSDGKLLAAAGLI